MLQAEGGCPATEWRGRQPAGSLLGIRYSSCWQPQRAVLSSIHLQADPSITFRDFTFMLLSLESLSLDCLTSLTRLSRPQLLPACQQLLACMHASYIRTAVVDCVTDQSWCNTAFILSSGKELRVAGSCSRKLAPLLSAPLRHYNRLRTKRKLSSKNIDELYISGVCFSALLLAQKWVRVDSTLEIDPDSRTRFAAASCAKQQNFTGF